MFIVRIHIFYFHQKYYDEYQKDKREQTFDDVNSVNGGNRGVKRRTEIV
jgi:hypothetical protein